jgi:nucleotide-binding universal stress UspA family protein
MFMKLTVAYNESPEAGPALASTIHLAKVFGAELRALAIVRALPAYTAYADAADSSWARILIRDRRKLNERLLSETRRMARREGVKFETHLPTATKSFASLATTKQTFWCSGFIITSSPVAHIASVEHGLCDCAGCSLQR